MFTHQFLETSFVGTNDKSAPKKLIIFFHGLGSNGDDLIALAPFMQKKLRNEFAFISPNGLEECDIGGFGYQWFSLNDRSETAIYSELQRVEHCVNDYIDQKLEQFNLEEKDVFLVGFSQGTMTSLHIGLNRKTPFAGIIGFSGSLIMPEGHKFKNKTPVCLVHGMYDDIVPFGAMDAAAQKIKEQDIHCDTYAIGNLMHSINERGLEYAINFIHKFS
jgi:phospholipase/carboxylesterase